MGFPAEGDDIDTFTVDTVRVEHVGAGDGRYEYPIEVVLRGRGGKDGARRALKPLLDRRVTIFTEYGNPYQCSIGGVKVETVEPGRYRVAARGVGVRVRLARELERYSAWLVREGRAAELGAASPEERRTLVESYMESYRAEADFSGRNPLSGGAREV